MTLKLESKIYLSPPNLTGSEQSYLKIAFEENWIAPGGPLVEQFEKTLKSYGQVENCLAVNSATAALHLAMLCLGIQEGDVVLCPTFTFVASINPVVYCGATPVFVDVNPWDGNMCETTLLEAIEGELQRGRRLKAIVVVHNYGIPANLFSIRKMAQQYGLLVIEDAAPALGSTYKGEPCGSMGDVGVVSFNGNKIITTSGGGVLFTNRKEVYKEALLLANQAKKGLDYQHEKVGYNYRLSNVLAAIGLGQMECLLDFVAIKSKNLAYYQTQLKDYPIQFLGPLAHDAVWNCWMVAVLFEDKWIKEKALKVFEQANIEVRTLWKPMHLQPIFEKNTVYNKGIAEDLYARGLCLPSGTGLTRKTIDRVVKVLKQVF